jgi:type VI secretion system protein ImpM
MSAGFYGKIPVRGDFVRDGLPVDFVTAWDEWWQSSLTSSRAHWGERWNGLWMEAPIWRFALSPGLCGAGAVIGLWLPSTDRVGRLFPLSLLRVAPDWSGLHDGTGFLDAAEAAGLAALEQDHGPDQLASALALAIEAPGLPIAAPLPGQSRWWTCGGPFVAAAERTLTGLPDETTFAAMLCGDRQDPANR